jgi:glycosyltransferase involved in cell wall biosynthesis
MLGNIERADRQGVQGWVRDDIDPTSPVSLVVSVDDEVVSRVLANVYRQDLEQAGLGNGRHGFLLKLDGLPPTIAHTVRISREDDSTEMPGSPIVIPPTLRFDAEMQDHLAKMLADAETDEDLTERATFLAQQADRLLQMRADRRSNRPDRTGHRQFRSRWSGRGAAAEPERPPRALVIDDTTPNANRDAGSQAVISHMRSLQRLGYAVFFAPANMEGGADVAAMEALGVACCCAPWSGSVEEVLRRESGGFSLIYLHRGGNARYLPLIRHHQPRARVVYSVADLHHLRLARQAEVEQRPELTEASQRVRAAELSAARFVDSVITHSSYEAALLKRDLPEAKIHVVPWSVAPRPTAVPWAERRGIAFVGSYGHAPNLDAAWWLIQEVMPLVRAEDDSIVCMLVGSNMPDSLKAAVSSGIQPVGRIESLPSLFDQIRLSVAPLAFGAGVKGKVLDSYAAGVPCACTPIAAEGLALPEALLGTVKADAASLAKLILRLHNDEAFNQACSTAGLAYVAEMLSETRLDTLMRTALGLRAP